MARTFGSDSRFMAAEARTTTIITYEEQTRGWMAYMARTKTVAQEIGAFRRLMIPGLKVEDWTVAPETLITLPHLPPPIAHRPLSLPALPSAAPRPAADGWRARRRR